MVRFWAICVAIFFLRDSARANSLDLQNEKSNSHELRDKLLRRRPRHIARLNGDLTLGAMLPIHISKAGLCSGLYVDGIMLVEAIIFALQEVKNRKLLPEGITLGYKIWDTCNSVIVAQRHTLDIVIEATKYERKNIKYMNDSNDPTVSYSTQDFKSNSLIAVVGAGNSEITVAVNRVLSAFNIPQIGFASTSRYLSEKLRFPSFFRTVPPDTYQVEGLVGLFEKFSWNYVGLLVSDGDYGRPLADSFTSSAKGKGICIAYEHLVPFQVNLEDAKSIVRELNSKANIEIVVMLLPEPDVKTMLHAMLEVGLTNKTLVASDSWSKAIQDSKLSNIVAGTLGFAHHYSQVKEFEDYFLNLKPSTNYWNRWFNETWEHIFNCVLPSRDHVDLNKTFAFSKKTVNVCNLEKQHLKRKHFTRFHYVSNIMNAVFAVAYGIKEFYRKEHETLFLPSSNELLKTLKEITFQNYDGENITFDENGDVSGKYNLVNIRPDLSVKNVGIWNGEYLALDDFESIWWNTELGHPPSGVCSVPCLAGLHKLASKADPQCCWTCQRCHVGTITNRTGASKCILCPTNHMTNLNQTACVFIPLRYLNWQSFWTISIVIMALISVSILIFVAMLFARYVNTPVVKSANRELSLLLGIGLFLTFLVPFAFAGKPTKFKCIISQMMFCVGCALALSAMLFRTLRIVMLFEFTNRRRWLLRNVYQIGLTVVLTFAELTYCLIWVGVNPPGVKTVIIRPTKRYLVCDFNKYWYSGSHLLLIFLSVVCTVLAIKGRKLPKNFNEVRHIGLSMFTFNIVWVVFMCAQYGASLEYDVKINCFAMIVSSLMILVLLFGPKVFVLLFRAHLNKKEEFEAEVRRYSFGVPNSNVPTSAISSRRGSSVTFRTANPASSEQFLSVDTNDLEKKRSHSFDAMASRIYNANRCLSKRCSKGTQTMFFTDLVNATESRKTQEIPPIIVRVEEEQDLNNFLKTRGYNYYNESNDTEPPDLRNSGSNYDINLDGVMGTESRAKRASSLHELNNLNQNRTIKREFECSNELDSLLKDLGVPNNDTPIGCGNSSVKSFEILPSNEGQTLFRTSPLEGAAKPERAENNFLETNINFDNENLNLTNHHRNGYDRETML